jgi:hypothetical protein
MHLHCRNTCECGKPVVFYSKKKSRYRADVHHSLCFRCYRNLLQKENLIHGRPVHQLQKLSCIGA